jgi:hypothetical protein
MRTQAASVTAHATSLTDTIPSSAGAPMYACLAARAIGELTIGQSSLAVGTLICALWAVSLAAQEPLRIRVAPTIVGTADSRVPLAVEIDPQGAVPPRSFLSVRGLPRAAALTDAHAIDPGSWAVPLASLPTLKAIIPTGLAGQSEITISLIALDGRLLAQAKTTLVIQPSSASAAPERPQAGRSAVAPVERPGPASPGAAPAPSSAPAPERRERALSPQDRQRALAMLKKGGEMLAAGNVSAARLLYERAADAGLAEAALALAATFDPVELGRRDVLGGVWPDAAVARRWYERARALGAPEAESRLKRIGAAER